MLLSSSCIWICAKAAHMSGSMSQKRLDTSWYLKIKEIKTENFQDPDVSKKGLFPVVYLPSHFPCPVCSPQDCRMMTFLSAHGLCADFKV